MYPSLETVKQLASQGDYKRIPVCREFSENMTHRGISFKNLRWNLPMNIFTVYISMILRTSILKSSRNIWRDFK